MIDEIEITRKMLENNGVNKQLLKTAEECAELAASLTRYVIGEGLPSEVILEAADVLVCLNYVKAVFGADKIEQQKNKRLEELKNDKYGQGHRQGR